MAPAEEGLELGRHLLESGRSILAWEIFLKVSFLLTQASERKASALDVAATNHLSEGRLLAIFNATLLLKMQSWSRSKDCSVGLFAARTSSYLTLEAKKSIIAVEGVQYGTSYESKLLRISGCNPGHGSTLATRTTQTSPDNSSSE